jgi:hypothetical protein
MIMDELSFYSSVDLNEACKNICARIGGDGFASMSLNMSNRFEWKVSIYVHIPGEIKNILWGAGDNPQAALNNLTLNMDLAVAEGNAWWADDKS